ncbi:MAG TPA: TonB-dependent receptor [Ramlibacter sp.]|uniref:TonB-dependent receptor plug domain-containing protein n=1 Tax=Ramlibacter sp. TaxID=1917967 RepID=UPI002BEAF60B|nr:TonB-dependent receptor [Ramlibacter sp.]HVZ42591.1 TonB-dependent receptor [Ramlibacter sp.]
MGTTIPSRLARACLAVALYGTMHGAAIAQRAAPAGGAASIADLSLEQLGSIEVTSVGKRVQRLADVAGSVYVVSHEDIRRSGATTLPEALRLAPNLQVARADANQYAIAARGFNSVLANKMLVLIDGRTVYSPLFSGVFWEAQDVLLEDVERIEVLSGAGGTLYGSNAVNGVINIITRSAAETQGALVEAGGGGERRLAAARYGFAAGDMHWRAYAKRTLTHSSELGSGAPVRDAAQHSQAGFRGDGFLDDTQLTVQGDVYRSAIDQVPAAREISGWNLLGRATRDLGSAGRVQLQAYFDHTGRDQPGAVHDALDTFDIDLQHLWQPRPGHQFLWGAGWRAEDDRLTNLAPAVLSLLPPDRREQLWNVFAQDEVELRDRLRVTMGIKAEHNAYTGLEWLPNLRLAWEFAPRHLLWAAASRAVRAPARVDRDFYSPLINGGPFFRSEIAHVYELGLRGQPKPQLSWNATLFHHRFDRLRSIDLTPAGVTLNNNFEAQLTGVETWAQWRASERWRLQAAYAWQHLNAQPVPGAAPLLGVSSLGNDPRYRASLSSSWDLPHRMELDATLRRVGALPAPAVPAYTALDLRWGWHVSAGLELSVALRNLGGRHPEWGAPASRAEFGPNVFAKAEWRL